MTEQILEETATKTPIYSLPPLILHPFAEPAAPQKLAESSRASLMIQGLLPPGKSTAGELQRTLLDGRYSEIRMLYYVGKDLLRWIEQCTDSLARTEGGLPAGIEAQSFAALLIHNTPDNVSAKLKKWGVNDFKSIFGRGLGLNAMFAQLPAMEILTDDFLRHYFQYADQLFHIFQNKVAFNKLNPEQVEFDLFSSGEYSRMLERSWE